MSHWYRHADRNNFYIPVSRFQIYKYWTGVNPDAHVTFINTSQWETLRKIEVSHGEDGTVFLKLVLSPKPPPTVIQVIKRWIDMQVVHFHLEHKRWGSPAGGLEETEYQFEFTSTHEFVKWTENLNMFNRECKQEIFSSDIIQELKTISEFCATLQKRNSFPTGYQHRIPVLPKPPRQSHHTRLIALLYPYIRKGNLASKDLELVKIYLSQGDDPNEVDPMTQFTALEITGDLRVYELLLVYHTDPTKRDHSFDCLSAYDQAFLEKDAAKLKLLDIVFSFIERPLPLRIKDLKIFKRGNSVITTMDCCDANDPKQTVTEHISTELKTSLESHEEDYIIDVTQKSFAMENDPDKTRLTEAHRLDLHRKNQIFEIIHNPSEKIGYIFYELIPGEEAGEFYWYCNTAQIRRDYRDTGIITFLLWRQVYALQERYPGAVFKVGFLGIHENSYRLVTNILHWPMYQPAHMEKEIRFLLKKIGIDPDSLQHHVLICYVPHQMMVVEPPKTSKPKPSLLKTFFYRELLGEENSESSAFKAATMMFPVTDETRKKFKKHCELLGISLDGHSIQLGPLLDSFHRDSPLSAQPKHSHVSAWKDSKILFWTNQRVASNTVSTLPRAKL